MKNANINVRLEESVYKRAKELGVDFSEVVRTAIINEIELRRIEEIRSALGTASQAVRKMGKKSILKEIRHMRESR